MRFPLRHSASSSSSLAFGLGLVLALVAPCIRADFNTLTAVGAVQSVQRTERGVLLGCANGDAVRVTVLEPGTVRVRTLFAGQPDSPDHSWAVAKTDWPAAAFEFAEEKTAVTLRTAELEVVVQRDPLLVTFRDAATKRVLNADAQPVARNAQNGRLGAGKRLGVDERFYGLGEKAARLEKRRGRFEMWNSDTPGYVLGTDPIYQSVPFYCGLEDGVAYGLFYDNSHRSLFDLGHSQQEYVGFNADGGELDYYFFRGPTLKQVLARFTELTGRMPMPPLWALGNQQCRYSYYPDTLVEEMARRYRQHALPLDVLYLDIHYMDAYRVFTWDKKRFPDPGAMNARLDALGVKVVTIIDPGVKFQPPPAGAQDAANAGPNPDLGVHDQSYYVFNQGVAADYFLHRKDGSLYIGEVWPGKSVFVDYTKEAARKWWGDLHRALTDRGVDGIWTDMNEPSDFVDKSGATQTDVVFDDLGTKSLYAKHRNLFALNMARATYEGLARLQPDKRPFVITRAGYAGVQRYAVVWTGDNNATWDSLALNIPMFASLGMSGQPFVGADVPGFLGRASPELLVRSYQVGFLAPLLRNHAAIDNYDHEPWRFGPVYTDIVRKLLETRYRLLPYLYTTLEEAHRTGTPWFRPLVLEFQDDANAFSIDDQYMVGGALLAAPILKEGARSRDLYLPAGRWYDFWTGAAHDGERGRLLTVAATLEQTPLFVRGGRIVPSTLAMQHTGEKPWDPIRFDVYPDVGGNAVGELYEDDGASPAYQKGKSRRTTLRFTRDAEKKTARLELAGPVGDFTPPARKFTVAIHGAELSGAKQLLHDGKPLEGVTRDANGALVATFSDDGQAHVVEVR